MEQNKQGKKALIIVDMQYDFCEDGGSLGVKDSLQIIPVINEIRKLKFDHIIYTRDYHPQNHISFASNHAGQKPFTQIDIGNGNKLDLWPDHCVQGTKGCEIHEKLVIDKKNDIEILKGSKKDYETYSGFGVKEDDSGLNSKLKELNVTTTFVVGLAYDFCVGSTAYDSATNGFETYVVTDATKSVMPESEKIMDEKLSSLKNLKKINSQQLQQLV